MKIGFFLREAIRATRRSSASSFAALATVLVTMLMLGVFIPIVQATNGAAGTFDPAVQTVSNKKTDTRKILQVTNLVTITAAVLTVLLVVASVLLIANTIRLSLYARRREVEVMKLVGATDWFIRWPFVIEGVFVGAFGALLAIVVLGVTKVALLDPLANHWTLIAAPRTIAFSALVAVLLGAAVVVSAVGSGLSLRRFLRV